MEQTLNRRGDRAPVLVRTKSRKAGDGNFSNQSLQIRSPSVQAPAHDEMGTGRGTGAQWRAATQSEAGEQRGDSPRPDHTPSTFNKILQPFLFISIFIWSGVSLSQSWSSSSPSLFLPCFLFLLSRSIMKSKFGKSYKKY